MSHYSDLTDLLAGHIAALENLHGQVKDAAKTVPLCDRVWSGYRVDILHAATHITTAASFLRRVSINPPPTAKTHN